MTHEELRESAGRAIYIFDNHFINLSVNDKILKYRRYKQFRPIDDTALERQIYVHHILSAAGVISGH